MPLNILELVNVLFINSKERQFIIIEKEPGIMPRRIEGDLREIKWIDETKEVKPVESSPSFLVANLPFRERIQKEAEPCPKCGTKRLRKEDPRSSDQSRSLRTEGPSRKRSKTDTRIEETEKQKAKRQRRHRRVSRRKIKEKENEDRMNNYLINFKRVVAKYRPSKNRYSINRELEPQEMEIIIIVRSWDYPLSSPKLDKGP